MIPLKLSVLLGLATFVAALPLNGIPQREQAGIPQLFEDYQQEQQSEGHIQLKRSAAKNSSVGHSTTSGSQGPDTPSRKKMSDVHEDGDEDDAEEEVSLRGASMNPDDLNCNPNESRIILRCITCTCDSQGIRESCSLRTCGL